MIGVGRAEAYARAAEGPLIASTVLDPEPPVRRRLRVLWLTVSTLLLGVLSAVPASAAEGAAEESMITGNLGGLVWCAGAGIALGLAGLVGASREGGEWPDPDEHH